MADTINIDVKATDRGLHVLVWENDEDGDPQCMHDLTIPWHRISLARGETQRKNAVQLGGFNIHFNAIGSIGDLELDGGFQIEEVE